MIFHPPEHVMHRYRLSSLETAKSNWKAMRLLRSMDRVIGRATVLIVAVCLVSNCVAAQSASGMASPPDSNARIVGGTAAQAGQWPSMIALYETHGRANRMACGGTIIDRRWALTAAHCVINLKTNAAIPATKLFIVEGTVDLQRGGRRIGVTRIVTRSNSLDYSHPNDIALLELAQDAQSPRQALVSNYSARLLPRGASAIAVGFGGLKPATMEEIERPDYGSWQSMSSRLMQVDLSILGHDFCAKYGSFNPSGNLCLGAEGAKGTCHGDSGGPAYYADKFRRIIQVGLLSGGWGCGQPNSPKVFTFVGYHREWIVRYVPNAVFEEIGADQSAPAVTATGTGSPALQQIVAQQPPAPPSQFAQVTVEVLPGNVVRFDQLIGVRVTSSIAGRLLVFNREENGQAILVFPSRASRAAQAGRQLETIKAGETIVLPSAGSGFQLRAGPPAGENNVIAVVLPDGARTEDIAERYGNLSPIADLDRVFVDLAQQTKDIRVEDGRSDRAVGQRSYRIVP